jgi:hypothetical protein
MAEEDSNGIVTVVVICLSLCCIFPDACGDGGGRQLEDGEHEIGGRVLTESEWQGMSQREKADLIEKEMDSYE